MRERGGARRQRRPLLSDDVVGPGTLKVEVETLDGKKKRRTCGWITSNEEWGDWEEVGAGGAASQTHQLYDRHPPREQITDKCVPTAGVHLKLTGVFFAFRKQPNESLGAFSAFRAQTQVEQLISATKIFKSTLGINFAPHAHKGPCIHLAPTQRLLFFTFRGHFCLW